MVYENNITDLMESLRGLGETLEDNLKSMGVSGVSAEDGLTSLANEILNIEPTISGLELVTGLTLSCDKNEVRLGDEYTLISNLSAIYDDETQINADLFGVLTGATILFKDSNGNTLAQSVTNNNGVATVNMVSDLVEGIVITSFFMGTENFDSCNSDSINISVPFYMEITADKSRLVDEVEDIQFTVKIIGDIPNDVNKSNCYVEWYDDNNGRLLREVKFGREDSYVYTTDGVSDVNIRVKLVEYFPATERTRLQEVYTIKRKVIYYDDCSGEYSSLWQTNPTYTTIDGYNVLYNNKSLGNIPTDVSNVMIEFDMRAGSSWGGLDIRDSSTCFVFYRNAGQTVNDHGALISPILSNGVWSSCKCILNNGLVQVYVNGNLVGETTRNVNGQIYFSGGSNTYPFYLKEIKITEL